MSDTLHFLNMAIELARANIAAGGVPSARCWCATARCWPPASMKS